MSRETGWLLLGVALLALLVLALGARRLDEPGLYYDEVIQATPASEFLRERGEALRIPGARNTRLFGGWFPLLTQPYMGALKSQLLIPTFAAFGASRETLRVATLTWACVGLLLVALWVRELAGTRVALATAALLALDPSFLFVSRHDWGSAALALACRGGGLYLATVGWQRGGAGRLLAGGLLLGLGVYNKIDLLPFLAGCLLGLLAAAPGPALAVARQRPARLGALALGLVLGALPMLVAVGSVLSATEAMFRSVDARPDALGEKLLAWRTLLDGSHFHRLMLAGGSFERLGGVAGAAWSPFGWIFGAAWLGLFAHALAAARRGEPDRPAVFALAATLATALLLLATPRAARIHHVMNIQPLPQLVVALAAVRLAQRGRAARGMAIAGLAAALVGGLRVDLRVFETLRSTGGSGRWSGALEQLAHELPDDVVVVSLDWGFHAPLRFVRPELALAEPVWRIHGRQGSLEGGPRHLYLVHEPGYEVFDVGPRLLEAVAQLPPDLVTVRVHSDRSGQPAFRSIAFARPHQLVYREDVEVRLR
ncbi:MAG: glycosyltransferase family 39 protein [Myxococcota bacterium]